MKSKDVFKQLLPGLIIGFILGCILITIVGVDTENVTPNIIGAIMSCAVPQLLNGIIVLKGTAKVLNRKLSIGKAFVLNIPYILTAIVLGFIFARVILMMAFGIDLREIAPLHNTLIYASYGAVISTILSYFLLKSYEKK